MVYQILSNNPVLCHEKPALSHHVAEIPRDPLATPFYALLR